MPSFKPIFPRQITQPLKSVWRGKFKFHSQVLGIVKNYKIKVEKIKDAILKRSKFDEPQLIFSIVLEANGLTNTHK
jgi:hypothetical protein